MTISVVSLKTNLLAQEPYIIVVEDVLITYLAESVCRYTHTMTNMIVVFARRDSHNLSVYSNSKPSTVRLLR